MSTTHTYGYNTFEAYSRSELDKLGYTVNNRMWIGDGWFFCKICVRETPHYAMSHHTRKQECVEVCRICDNYSGKAPVITEATNGQNSST